MEKKYNGGLKFGSAAESSGLQREPFPTHNGVQPGPLNSGSPAKYEPWSVSKDIMGEKEISKKDVKPPVGTKGTDSKPSSSNKPYVKPGGKATGKIGDYAQGSKERTAEYDARGWAHDKTTTGHKDYKKSVDIQKTEPTKKEKVDQTPKIKGSFEDNYQEGSEKTKRLSSKLQKKDKQTEDAYVEKELAEAHEGKYGKGIFGGYLRRQGAKGKHKRKGRQEDRVREKYNESKDYDAMTPEQRASADATKKADRSKNRKLIEAEFKDAANIIGGSGHKGGSGDALRAQVSKNEQLTQNKTDQKIKTDKVNLATTKANEDRALINEGRRLTNKQRQLSIDASAKAKAGNAEVPAAEGTFAANEEGPNMEGTTADKLYKNYSA